MKAIDLSYVSIQIKQSGFHGMNSQPSDKSAATYKVCPLIVFYNLVLSMIKLLCLNCVQLNGSFLFFQNLWCIYLIRVKKLQFKLAMHNKGRKMVLHNMLVHSCYFEPITIPNSKVSCFLWSFIAALQFRTRKQTPNILRNKESVERKHQTRYVCII